MKRKPSSSVSKTPLLTDEAWVLKRALHATVCVLFLHTSEMNVTFGAGKWIFQMVPEWMFKI